MPPRAPGFARPRLAGFATVLLLAGCGAAEPPPALDTLDVPATTSFDGTSPGNGDGTPFDGFVPRPGTSYPPYDLTVVLPYGAPEQTFALDVQSQAARLDVHLSIDTTGSFRGEIRALQNELNSVVLPQLRTRTTDLAVGISRFADFPVAPFGLASDRPYDLLTAITTDASRVSTALGRLLPLQDGDDIPEAWAEAVYAVATGAEFRVGSTVYIPRFTGQPPAPGMGAAGGVGFRANSARVVVNFTDAPAHEPAEYAPAIPGAHGTAGATAALQAIGARFIGIAASEAPRPQYEAMAIATGATMPAVSGACPTGLNGTLRRSVGALCPLVFDIAEDGTGLSRTLLDAILSLLDQLAFREVHGEADDPHGFVTAIEAAASQPPTGTPAPDRVDRLPAGMLDGVLDTFTGVSTRTRLTFRVHLRNLHVPTDEFPQLFFLQVRLLGDGVLLGVRTVRVIVPEGPKPDSGVGDASAAPGPGGTTGPMDGGT